MSANAFADGVARGLGIFRQAKAIKEADEEKAYNRKMQKQLFDMRMEDREYGRQRDAIADQRYQDTLDYRKQQYQDTLDYRNQRDAVGDARYQDSRNYQRGRDTVADQRYQDTLDYRKNRDAVQDSRYQDNQAYRKNRDQVTDERWDKNFEAQKGIRALQQQNMKGQIQDRQDKRHQANLKRIANAYALAQQSEDAAAMERLSNAYIGAWNMHPERRAMLQAGTEAGQTKVMTGMKELDDGRLLPQITTYDKEGNELNVGYLSRDRSSNPQDPYMSVDRDALFGDVMNDPAMAHYMLEADAGLSRAKGKNRYQTVTRYDEFGQREGEDVYRIDEEQGGLVPMPIIGKPQATPNKESESKLPEPELPPGMKQEHIEQFIKINPGATEQDAINAWSMR